MATWRSASSSTQLPSATIRPVSSATGMNCAGWTTVPSARCQRASASTPTSRLSESPIIGWYSNRNSPRSRPRRMSFSMLSREITRSRTLLSNTWYPAGPARLRLVHGGVGVADQHLGGGLVADRQGDADARPRPDLLVVRGRTAPAARSGSARRRVAPPRYPARFSHRMTNSSPPNRAIVSLRRADRTIRRATSISSASPAA